MLFCTLSTGRTRRASSSVAERHHERANAPGVCAWAGSNLDELLAPFSIRVEPSTVLQAVPGETSMHPAHACIGADSILSKSLAAALTSPTLPIDQPQSRDLPSVSCPLMLLSLLLMTAETIPVLSDKATLLGLYCPLSRVSGHEDKTAAIHGGLPVHAVNLSPI